MCYKVPLYSAKNPAPPKIFCRQKSAKNPMLKIPKKPTKICYAKIQQKSFMISLTKNLLKTLNISKNFLILHSTTKTKTHARINHTQ